MDTGRAVFDSLLFSLYIALLLKKEKTRQEKKRSPLENSRQGKVPMFGTFGSRASVCLWCLRGVLADTELTQTVNYPHFSKLTAVCYVQQAEGPLGSQGFLTS